MGMWAASSCSVVWANVAHPKLRGNGNHRTLRLEKISTTASPPDNPSPPCLLQCQCSAAPGFKLPWCLQWPERGFWFELLPERFERLEGLKGEDKWNNRSSHEMNGSGTNPASPPCLKHLVKPETRSTHGAAEASYGQGGFYCSERCLW